MYYCFIQGAIVVQLINRFKEFRRERKSHNTQPDAASSKRKQTDVAKKQPGDYSVIPTVKIEEGEDEFSFQQHQKKLKAEHKKRQPDDSLVDDLMTRSFGMRRKDITENGYSGVQALFEVYPFLQDYIQVFGLCMHLLLLFFDYS